MASGSTSNVLVARTQIISFGGGGGGGGRGYSFVARFSDLIIDHASLKARKTDGVFCFGGGGDFRTQG